MTYYSVKSQLHVQNMIVDSQIGVNDFYPSYHEKTLFNSLFYEVNLNDHTVLLKNLITVTFEDVINVFHQIM